jgi:hypothetical protein
MGKPVSNGAQYSPFGNFGYNALLLLCQKSL